MPYGSGTAAHNQIVIGVKNFIVSICRPHIRVISDFDGLRKPLPIRPDSGRAVQKGFHRRTESTVLYLLPDAVRGTPYRGTESGCCFGHCSTARKR